MNVTTQQLELIEIQETKAYLSIDGTYSFEVDFQIEVEKVHAEKGYENGTGLEEGYEITFFDVVNISHAYDSDNESKGEIDINKSELEGLINEYIVFNQLEENY